MAAYPYRVPNPLTLPWLRGHPVWAGMNPSLAGKVPGYAPSVAPVSPVAPPRAPTVGATPTAQPSRPPLGSYDPTLDYQETTAQLGLSDLLQNQGITAGQQSADYKFGRQGIQTQRKQGMEDIQKRFQDMKAAQTQAANVAGVEEGGTPHRSGVIRGKLEDTATSRLKTAIQRQQQQMALSLQRQRQAQALSATRSKRDYALYSQALGTNRWWQAYNSGFPIGGMG